MDQGVGQADGGWFRLPSHTLSGSFSRHSGLTIFCVKDLGPNVVLHLLGQVSPLSQTDQSETPPLSPETNFKTWFLPSLAESLSLYVRGLGGADRPSPVPGQNPNLTPPRVAQPRGTV